MLRLSGGRKIAFGGSHYAVSSLKIHRMSARRGLIVDLLRLQLYFRTGARSHDEARIGISTSTPARWRSTSRGPEAHAAANHSPESIPEFWSSNTSRMMPAMVSTAWDLRAPGQAN